MALRPSVVNIVFLLVGLLLGDVLRKNGLLAAVSSVGSVPACNCPELRTGAAKDSENVLSDEGRGQPDPPQQATRLRPLRNSHPNSEDADGPRGSDPSPDAAVAVAAVVAPSAPGAAAALQQKKVCRPSFPFLRSRTSFPVVATQLRDYILKNEKASQQGTSQEASPPAAAEKPVFRWVEIGVRECFNMEQFFNMLTALLPGVTLESYGVDSWGYRGPEPGAQDHNNDEGGKYGQMQCERAMKHRPGVRLIKNLSAAAASAFPDDYFDLVYIDALHTYEGCLSDMHSWFSKAKPGALFAGDDFGDMYLPSDASVHHKSDVARHFHWGVVRAVTDFAINKSVDYHVTSFETHYDARYSPRQGPEIAVPNWYIIKEHPLWEREGGCFHVRWPGDTPLRP